MNAHPLITGNLKSKTNWVAFAMAALGVLQDSFPQILALLPTGSNAYLVAAALMIVMRNVTTKSVADKGAQPPPERSEDQAGFARAGALIALTIGMLFSLALLVGCTSTPSGGQELSATGKVALQEVAAIATRRYLSQDERAAEKARNIREIARELQTYLAFSSLAEIRGVVLAEIDRRNLSPVDRADAISLLNIFEALLRERIGSDELDADALVRVNELLAMIVNALPPPVSQ